MREVPKFKGTDALVEVDLLLKFLLEKQEPKIIEPLVWLFILQSKVDVKVATKFATLKLKDYDSVELSYVPTKVEMLANYTN